jgi:hypothetical protein
MSMNTKRVLLAAVSLLVLLIVGLLIAQIGGGNGDGHPVASVSPSPSASTPGESPSPKSPKEAVREAYLQQWVVYAHAVFTLKANGVNKVFAGKALKVVRAEIARRHRTQTPSQVRVKHNLAVRIINPSTAVVDDRYINHTVTIDPKTGKPTEPDPNQLVHEVYTMKKVQGLWKVSAIVRQSVRRRKP